MTEPKPLAGRTAWVTGAATGIGEATALTLARAGASVVLTGRRAELLDALAARIAEAGGTARVMAGDVTDAARLNEIAATLGREGRLDLLVNNAGTNIPGRSFAELTPEAVDLLVQTNLTGTLQASRAAFGLMRAQGGGLLIQIASWAAYAISEGPGPIYTAAKSGVVAMSRALNLEGNRLGIRSCVISPGDVHTPLMSQRPVRMTDEQRARMLKPQDLADLALTVACLPDRICVNEIAVGPTFR